MRDLHLRVGESTLGRENWVWNGHSRGIHALTTPDRCAFVSLALPSGTEHLQAFRKGGRDVQGPIFSHIAYLISGFLERFSDIRVSVE
jgi:hypothetical protein